MSNTNFTIQYTPGYQFQAGELVTIEKLNALGSPTINVVGSFSEQTLGNGAVGIANLQSGMFTADNTGRSPFALGFVNNTLMQPDAYFYTGSATGTGGSGYTVAFVPAITSYLSNGVQAFTQYWDGLRVMFKANRDSSGGETLNAGLGAAAIYRADGKAVGALDIKANEIVEVIYSTALPGWQMQRAAPSQYKLLALTMPIGALASTANMVVTVAHGLGAIPTRVRWVLRCNNTEAGYAAGAEIDLLAVRVATSHLPKFSVWADATNVYCAATNGGYEVVKADGTGLVTLAASGPLTNWNLKAYANL